MVGVRFAERVVEGQRARQGFAHPRQLRRWFAAQSEAGSLVEYLRSFDLVVSVMQTEKALTRITREFVTDLAEDGVIYGEVRWAPEQHLAGGLTPEQAIIDACLARFRPILMTTMAALLGAVPFVIATGPGAELRRPLGITIIGGLIVSQVLTLYTTPVIYLLLDRLHRRISGGSQSLLRRVTRTGSPTSAVPAE